MSATSHFIGRLLTKESCGTDEKHDNQQDKCKRIAEGGLSHGHQGCLSQSQDKASDDGSADKVCDQIADGILDAYLEQDSKSRVAVEAMASANTLMLAGEVTSKGRVDVAAKAREIIRNIGYTEHGKGFDADTCMILTNIHNQSPRYNT